MAYVCIHAHDYQPTREDPWTGVWPAQPSAAPFHDWNERIAAECYAPCAAARLLDGTGRTRAVRNLYADISFDIGPTLLQWLQAHSPVVHEAILRADQASRHRFGGHGSAMAQGYHHAILPLCNARDRRTEIAWGIRDFQLRFGRAPEGFWLPEAAVDTASLTELARQGIRFVVLAPHQLHRVRPHGQADWQPADRVPHLTTRAYTLALPDGASIVAIPYDDVLARGVAFRGVLHDGEAFGRDLAQRAREAGPDGLVHFATDGESYGHHHRKGEMGLARALEVLDATPDVQLVNYGQFLDLVPPTWQAELAERTSWSCAHGIERWRSDCGCTTPLVPGWHQRWRGPLRQVFDHLRDTAQAVLAPHAAALFSDPDAARNDYIDLLRPHSADSFARWNGHHGLRSPLTPDDHRRARTLLEIERHLLAMYTSCAWFFEDATRIEAQQNLRHAACALGLLHEAFGVDLHDEVLRRVAALPANKPTQELVDLIEHHRAHPRPIAAPHAPSTLDALAEEGEGAPVVRGAPIACAHRAAGLLQHVTALPGTGPIGDLDAVVGHIDWMVEAGLSVWQVLPLGPTGMGGSPYSSWSSLSGDPRLVGFGPLVRAGLLHPHEVHAPEGPLDAFDADLVATWKMPLLERAAQRLLADAGHPWRPDLQRFVDQHAFVADAGLFRALQLAHDGQPWWTWPAPLRDRDDHALAEARATHADAIATWSALAFFFETQWQAAHTYATARGVKILGDLPIYVGHDSVDVWAHPEVFQLEQGVPTHVAGVPPDAFSEDGQRWGNPIYDWDALARTDYAWWRDRLARAFAQTDLVRLDHFIGFVRYWSIPGDAPDATTGTWEQGPGLAFFDAMERQLGTLPLIVEDLGCVRDDVRTVQTALGYPGMRVLQFGFDGDPANEHLPEHHPTATVAYVGTHDNDTAVGWWNTIGPEERARVRQRFQHHHAWPHEQLHGVLMRSPGILAIVSPQDLLGLGSQARFNIPGTVSGNWRWRQRPGVLDSHLAGQVRDLVVRTGRLPPTLDP